VLPLDAVAAGVSTTAAVTLPDGNKVAVTIHSDGRDILAIGGVTVDLKLAALGRTGTIVALTLDGVAAGVAAAAAVAVPNDDKIAIAVQGDGRVVLAAVV
jgi:hypothetical protein